MFGGEAYVYFPQPQEPPLEAHVQLAPQLQPPMMIDLIYCVWMIWISVCNICEFDKKETEENERSEGDLLYTN